MESSFDTACLSLRPTSIVYANDASRASNVICQSFPTVYRESIPHLQFRLHALLRCDTSANLIELDLLACDQTLLQGTSNLDSIDSTF